MNRTERNRRLFEVATVFLKLGTIGFGGPSAHIAMMDEEIVNKRRWVDRQQFLDLWGATNLIPGPNSTELAIHLGYLRAGWLGLLVAGCSFILPAMLIVWLLAFIYMKYETLPQLTFILEGVKPVIAAVILQALWGLSKTAIKTKWTATVGLLVLVMALLGINELLLLLAAGVLVMLVENRKKLRGVRSLQMVMPLPLLAAATPDAAKPIGLSLLGLFFTFVKIGSVLYGSGYVLVAYLQNDFVHRQQVISPEQLVDAVAIGQFTPGPLFTTATFIGYLVHGSWGAILATIGIFLPAFVFVALIHPWIPKLRRSSWVSYALDGINVASLAFMAAVTWRLGLETVTSMTGLIMLLVTFILLIRYKVNSAWLVLGGGCMGWLCS